ncbi:HTTM domain-containing protein [Sorangium sp. So ce1036]|uniref:HTTM domain-containing protein n=1 Tax=Sorangium sp. So ce1036 TaxID=3133328 RepID=UPI003F07D09B
MTTTTTTTAGGSTSSTCTASTSTSTSTRASTGAATGIDLGQRWSAAADHLTAEVDAASLAVFRIAYGSLIAWEVVRYVLHDRIYRYYIEPSFFFSYLPFVRPWGGTGMYWHFAAIFVLSLLCAVGLFYRVSAALLCAALTVVFLLDKAQYLNHLYLVCLLGLLLAAAPAHRALSLDRLRARRAPSGAPAETAPRLHLFALKAQIAIVYFYGGVAKLNGDWLRGQPLTMWLADRGDAPLVGPLLAAPATGVALSYAGLLIDLSMGFLLFHRRTFPLGAALALAFNLANALLFNIGIFPYVMIASLALFADPSWPRRRLPSLFRGAAPAGGGGDAARPTRGGGDAPMPARRRALPLALLHGYLLVQLLVPLRHWLYPGDVAWNEAGHRFSWRMKLRDKAVSELGVFVVDPRTGVREALDLEEWLTERQLGEMCTRPDMLIDLAHHVADRFQEAFGVRPIVTAKVVASLNGGPYRDLVDPTCDLASQPRGLLAIVRPPGAATGAAGSAEVTAGLRGGATPPSPVP